MSSVSRGALEVVPGVRMLPLRTPTLPPATHTNAYLVGTEEAVLVEPASPYDEEVQRTVAWLRGSGLTVRALVLTHHHADHVGGARILAERLELPVWGHRATAERLAGQIRIDRLLADGERIALSGPAPPSLRAVHTPGHAPGHLCFLEERSNALIAGDMVASVGTILVEPEDGDMALYLASLERMRDLGASVLLPAHGDPIPDPRAHLDHYIQHRRWREQRVLEALERLGGQHSVAELVPHAYDDAPREVWALAQGSTEAHLLKLLAEGRVSRSGPRWRALAGSVPPGPAGGGWEDDPP